MSRTFQLLHHRSLTVSIVALFMGFYALAFLPEHGYWLQQNRATFLLQSALAAGLGMLYCAFNLVILLRDNRSGYPSFRCSLATLLWTLACFPVLFLAIVVIGDLCK